MAGYEIVSDVDNGGCARDELAARTPPQAVLLTRHPQMKAIQRVTVNGKPWQDFDPKTEVIRPGFRRLAQVAVEYQR